MNLHSGQNLLHYRLIEKLGEGGMGVVWKAADTVLDREVAIKVLPAIFAEDTERMARFEREAKLLGSLNHPNIATIYGLHQAQGIRFIAMELVRGEDLAQRLQRGPLPIGEAAEIGVRVADALEAAHERGVIHRDLKPANVRLSDDGAVKVLDFGLAKAFSAEPGQVTSPDLSPTVTSDRTRNGVILGTAAYMSPEQARGRAVDRRTDVWAFGCLLYECLAGRKAFPGETISDTLAAILKSEPDWGALPKTTPAPLRQLLRRCLAKETRRRLNSLGDARLEIEEAADARVSPAASRSRILLSPWLVIPGVAALVILAVALAIVGNPDATDESSIRYQRLTYQRGWVRSARVAPDGRTVVYSAAWEDRSLELFLRRIDATDAVPVALEPRRARLLSISRQGEMALLLPPEVGALRPLSLRRGTLATVAVTGGTPRAIAEEVEEADWGPSGERFALARRVGRLSQLEYPSGEPLYRSEGFIGGVRVSPSGDRVAFLDHPYFDNNRGFVSLAVPRGEVRRLTVEIENLTGLAWSPDGREIWFSGADERGLALFAVSLSGDLRVLRRLHQDSTLHDVTAEGQVLVSHGDFHVGVSVKPRGQSHEHDFSWMGTSFVTDLSADGEWILFMEQRGMEYEAWLRRTDGAPPTRLGTGMSFGLSPDHRWALSCLPSLSAPLTLLPTGPGSPRKLTGSAGVLWAAWMPGGESVVWAASNPTGDVRLYEQEIDSGEARLIFEGAVELGALQPFLVSPDGEWVALTAPGGRILLYPLAGGEPRELPGSLPGDQPSAWTEDGRGLYVSRLETIPAQVFRVDLEDGSRTLWREFAPRDLAGIGGLYTLLLTPDGKAYAYSYVRRLDSLYLMTGLE
jgi:serine/threonine protein kinase/Tol biopolymer transport system component